MTALVTHYITTDTTVDTYSLRMIMEEIQLFNHILTEYVAYKI